MGVVQAWAVTASLAVAVCAQEAQKVTINVGGYDRSAYLHLPPKAFAAGLNGRPIPLIVNPHALGETYEVAMRESDFGRIADQEGFAVVWPQGLAPAGPGSESTSLTNLTKSDDSGGASWNAGSCCQYASVQKVDDRAYVIALMSHLKDNMQQLSGGAFSLDSSRVYMAGFSNGAFMTNRMVCQSQDLFAAVGTIAGVLGDRPTLDGWPCDPYECDRSLKMPQIHFHGIYDGACPYNGDPGRQWASAKDFVAYLIKRNNVEQEAPIKVFTSSDGTCTVWGNVEYCEHYGVNGGYGGHCWPGSPGEYTCAPTIRASEFMWTFFKKYTLGTEYAIKNSTALRRQSGKVPSMFTHV